MPDDRREEFVVSVRMPVQICGEETSRQAFAPHIFPVAFNTTRTSGTSLATAFASPRERQLPDTLSPPRLQTGRPHLTVYAGNEDFIFASSRLKGKAPRVPNMLVEDHLGPAAKQVFEISNAIVSAFTTFGIRGRRSW